jgi:hypothetical protein
MLPRPDFHSRRFCALLSKPRCSAVFSMPGTVRIDADHVVFFYNLIISTESTLICSGSKSFKYQKLTIWQLVSFWKNRNWKSIGCSSASWAGLQLFEKCLGIFSPGGVTREANCERINLRVLHLLPIFGARKVISCSWLLITRRSRHDGEWFDLVPKNQAKTPPSLASQPFRVLKYAGSCKALIQGCALKGDRK